MLYVVCYPKLSTADGQAIEAFRAKHEPARAAMVRAHITLVFGVKSIAPDDLTKLAAEIAAKTAAFDFTIKGMEVEAHEQGDHNLFLMIDKGRDALIALNNAFYAGVLALERGKLEFAPHITVATNADLKTVMMAAPEAKPLTAIAGRIDALAIVALNGATLTSIGTLPLAG